MAWIANSGRLPPRTTTITSSRDALRSGPRYRRKVVVQVVAHHGVAHGMFDVLDLYPVLERRRMDLHTRQSYYETGRLGRCDLLSK
jgi:hypothetical protein